MSQDLFVRIYNVGCGDCILVRVPDEEGFFHILIDCGNFYGDSPAYLKRAMDNVEELLNDEKVIPEKSLGVLDLLVVTHQHWDHMKGFESLLKTFKRIKVKRIWLSVGMNKNHAPGARFQELQNQVTQTFKRFESDPELSLNSGISSIIEMLSLSTEKASDAVINEIPSAHGIRPFYVYRRFEKDLAEKEAKEALLNFKEHTTKLFVLAPEKEIDDSYLGSASSLLEDLSEVEKSVSELVPEDQRIQLPTNISSRQFRQLKTQLLYTSLALVVKNNDVLNNTSVVLILEWRGRKLIFPGDAEQESWNLMWTNSKQNLANPVDFLKVAHHGSLNGTPYNTANPKDNVNRILDSILPKTNAAVAQAVVSTLEGRIHTVRNPVPYPDLMNELATRVRNSKAYSSDKYIFGKQPQRTDREQGDWIDIAISPNP